jgi:hypothetical protein
MKSDPREKPVAAETAHGLQVMERFGRLLPIDDSFDSSIWQTSFRYADSSEPTRKGRRFVRCQQQDEDDRAEMAR